jgi:hypothetical protein
MEKINHKISTPYLHAAYPRGVNEFRENPHPNRSRSTHVPMRGRLRK